MEPTPYERSAFLHALLELRDEVSISETMILNYIRLKEVENAKLGSPVARPFAEERFKAVSSYFMRDILAYSFLHPMGFRLSDTGLEVARKEKYPWSHKSQEERYSARMPMSDIQAQVEEWLSRPFPMRGSRSIDQCKSALGTFVGLGRSENQDRVVLVQIYNNNDRVILGILCDGLGGMTDGAICAQLGISAFVENFIRAPGLDLASRLMSSTMYADAVIYERYRGRGGTTLSAVAYDSHNACLGVNVGDSRIYSVNSEGTVTQKTEDDSLKQHFLRLGVQPRLEEGLLSPNQLAQFVGIGTSIRPHIIDIQRGSDVLITSDGAHFVGDEILSKVFCNAPNIQKRVDRTIYIAEAFGGNDNASLLFLSWPQWNDSISRTQIEIWDPFEKLTICPVLRTIDKSYSKQAQQLTFSSNEADRNTQQPAVTERRRKKRKSASQVAVPSQPKEPTSESRETYVVRDSPEGYASAAEPRYVYEHGAHKRSPAPPQAPPAPPQAPPGPLQAPPAPPQAPPGPPQTPASTSQVRVPSTDEAGQKAGKPPGRTEARIIPLSQVDEKEDSDGFKY